jgi:type-F conjugative transfer system pilin assembly protein TrbC
MRIKIRTYLFLLFGLQGILQVIYWELIKGYPACFMCKGYRVLYMSIFVTALLYRYRASFFRLLLLCGLITVETLWSGWDVIQKMGMFTQKCHAKAHIVNGFLVFTPCGSTIPSVFKALSSPIGINAILSILMCGYVVHILWRLKSWRLKGFRKSLMLIGLLFQDINATTHKDTAIQQVAKTQEPQNYASDAQDLYDVSEVQAKEYEAQARQIGSPFSKAALVEAKKIIHEHRLFHANKGSCNGKCSSFQPTVDMESTLQVCMSFSVPIQVWKDLNEDLIRHQGVFVVKGLPNNSFQAFAEKVLAFRKQGITAPIRIDPKLFERHRIQQVPLFVMNEKGETHTVSGTVTVPYVLDLMHIKKEGKQ